MYVCLIFNVKRKKEHHPLLNPRKALLTQNRKIGVACDNRENFALDFGKSFLHYGWEKNVDRLYEQVDAITAAQIQAVAQELFDKDRLTTLIFK